MSNILFTAAAATDIGNRRRNNEDNFYFAGQILSAADNVKVIEFDSPGNTQNAAYAVFDGMGGESCGELASEAAACEFAKCMAKVGRIDDPERAYQYLQKFYKCAQNTVLKLSKKKRSTMGTTAAIAVIVREKIIVSNIGDSKIFQYRDGNLIQLSEDHNMAEIMVRNGAMSREQAQKSLGADKLTRFIGAPKEDYDFLPFFGDVIEVQPGDCYLLCSDGLTNELTNDEMAEIIRNNSESCLDTVRALIKSALDHGGKDNITVILIRVGWSKKH